MGSMSIWHWIVVIGVVLLLFGRGKISDLMGDVAQGIKAFKKGMADDDKPAEKSEPVKTIDSTTTPLRTRCPWSCASSQSRVALADRAPSTDGELTRTSWSARRSTPDIAECSKPVPQSVMQME